MGSRHSKDMHRRKRPWSLVLAARSYPALSNAVLNLPLDLWFLRVTPEGCDDLLQRIQATFPDQLHRYNISVQHEILPL